MDMSGFLAELEARFDEARERELEDLIDELTDAERASVTLSARLAGSDGPVTLMLRGGGVVTGTILDSTRTWILVRGGEGDSLVMHEAIVGAWPLGRSAVREGACAQAWASGTSCANWGRAGSVSSSSPTLGTIEG